MKSFEEGDRLGGDDVDERASLNPGKEVAIDLLGMGLFAEDEAGAGASQGLVRRRCDEIAVGNGGRMQTCRDEARNVGDVGQQECSDRLGNGGDPRKIDDPGVGGSSTDDQSRSVLVGKSLHLLVVEGLILPTDSVRNDLVTLAGEVERVPVGKMSAVGKVHPENRISVLTGCQKDGHIGLASGVGLDVGVLGPKEFAGSRDGGPFDDVCIFTSPIVPATRVALGILVGEDGAGGFEDGLGDEIL